jgi:hypothetical protein
MPIQRDLPRWILAHPAIKGGDVDRGDLILRKVGLAFSSNEENADEERKGQDTHVIAEC